ncbi:MAG: CTP synthase [Candidatus Ryanbacteria bacterium RIFCSPLOWO2_01_FULL_48_26]|uniref:CTP synthase n=1 Tax=Candidatus Ryanbacteria bacterium RIFCSPLOWO2_01_FULL_48_26 TaxID=1802126 RepID=A0A1G2GRN2_9BACT|nr:MAG: CTP synthase [Candidatus Ryanbacteria bacterium RIFCSPLOWO2_01_FULL_48_26]
MAKYIFVVGGVMSGVGKGIASASIAKILQARGLEVTALKIDPYVNVDAGTMNPTEHGEVFVLDDGTECDQDMGNYERFLNRNLSKSNYMTTGSIYLSVIKKERNLEYGGKQVEVVPRIPLEVIDRIDKAAARTKAEVAIIEIGGTVGEYENILFLESVRMLKLKKPRDVAVVLVSFLPSLGAGGTELKTKPTQHAVRSLNSVGIHPDIILARAPVPLDRKRKNKIEFMCSLEKGDVISAPDVKSIYEVPMNFEKDKLGDRILSKLSLKSKRRDFKDWGRLVSTIRTAKKSVKIGIVGKYFGSGNFVLTDSYISVIEAVKHAAYFFKAKPEIEWIDSNDYEKSPKKLQELSRYDGIVVPGGFGSRGVEGKMNAIRYCREHKIPYLGLCYGMQLAVIEFARDVLGLKDAHTTEVDPKTKNPVIYIMPEQKSNIAEKKYGATMRLGSYPAVLKKGTIAQRAYDKNSISERHRHRYEVNPDYISKFEKKGLIFSGISPDRRLMEIVELPQNQHPFFVGTQFHPEFKSRPLVPHPLFREFVKAAIKKQPRKK